MSGVFRVHLGSLDVNIMSDMNAAPLLFAELEIRGRGDVYYDTDRHEERTSMSTALLTKLYYGTASVVSEIEKGRMLSESSNTSTMISEKKKDEYKIEGVKQNHFYYGTPSHVHLEGGGRLFLLHPVENGEYLLSVTIPQSLWRWMGEVTLQVLLATAIRGYDIESNIAAVISVPTYYSLHDRITENAKAVEIAVRDRMKQLVEFAAFLDQCGHSENASSEALLQEGQETVITLQKMCFERPSSIRVNNSRLSSTLEQLLWSATSCSDYIALNGALPSGGMCEGFKRLVVTASAMWYYGEPLFSNASIEVFESNLLPAVISAYGQKCLSHRNSNTIEDPITVKCLAMYSQTRRGGNCTAGYLKQQQQQQQQQEENASAVCVTFLSSGGWAIVLRLETALNVFSGASMPHIISGVRNIISTTLETPRFTTLVRQLMAGNMLSLGSKTNLTGSTLSCIQVVKNFGIFARYFTTSTCISRGPRDVCLYRYKSHNADTKLISRRGAWPEYMRNAVETLLKLATLGFRQRCSIVNNSSGIHSSSPFSLLRGKDILAVLLAVPVYGPIPKVLFFLAEINQMGAPTATELRAFAAWILSKVV